MPRSTCPKCGAVLQLADDMVNEEIECGSCQAIFVAKPDPPASRRGETDRPSRRRMSDPDEEERPSRRRANEEEEDQPRRRRSRDAEEEDEYNRPRRRRPAGGSGQGLAIASLILGIDSLPLGFCCGLFSLPVSATGVILGIIGITKSPDSKGLAITGTVLSGVGIVLAVLMVILGVAMNVANFGAGGGRPGPNNPPFGPQRNNPPPPWRR
jgi:hypothetical protein